MTQQEIEARALELYPERKRQNKNGTGEYDANLPRRKAYIKGWTDAQPTDEERQQVIDIIRRGMQNRIAAIVNPEMVRELTITPHRGRTAEEVRSGNPTRGNPATRLQRVEKYPDGRLCP